MSKTGVGISRKGKEPIRRIRIYDVGRGLNAKDFEVSTRASPDDIALRISEEANIYLLSRDISAIWHDDTGHGTIFAGIRMVGKAKELKL